METKSETQQMIHELKELREQVYALEVELKQTPSGNQRPEFLTEHPHIIRLQGVHGGRPIVRGVVVNVGDNVAAKQGVVILEAMKMENELRTPRAGIVKEVRVKAGDKVEQCQVLVVVK